MIQSDPTTPSIWTPFRFGREKTRAGRQLYKQRTAKNRIVLVLNRDDSESAPDIRTPPPSDLEI